MKKQLILLFTLIFTGIFSAAAQDPIYVVNGQVVSDIRNIPPGDIESTEMLPADEQTIARYGTEASNGVILITLRYDTPARFPEADGSFNDYISKQTDWDDSLPAARVVLRYKITTDGRTVPTDELEATDRRSAAPCDRRRRKSTPLAARHARRKAGRKRRGSARTTARRQKHSASLGIHHALNPTKPSET